MKAQILKLTAILLILAGGLGSCKDKSERWTVQLRLKSQTDEHYLAIEDPKIKALISKHRVQFYQSYPEFNPPVFLLYYTLTGNNSKENVIKDFLSTSIFDGNVREICIHFACGLTLKLKPQADENYLATEDPEIQALISKHGVALRQAAPGAQNPELLLYYTLSTMEDNREVNMVIVIKDFLATGKFEDDFHESVESHPAVG
ncbi:MAG: hypothetical protein FWE63_00720 [Bacteroidales bacterium]|nr:hypothetical protein [Bacteroidales bacterium]